MSGTRRMRGLIKAWESSFAGSWSLFALAALPGSLLAGWALIRLSASLAPIDYAEWAFLTVATTVIGSISQLGLKPGYMQYVTDHGKDARTPGLRAAMLLVSTTGAGAGLFLAFAFGWAAMMGGWQNTGVLFWLIPLLSIGNITMMLHTDLRILGRSSVIALLSLLQVPVFIGVLELCLVLTEQPLTALYATNTLVGFLFALAIAFYGGVFRATSLDRAFIKWAVALGLPAMGALLSKYSADLTVSASFRWIASEQDAGLYGLALKLTEPLMGLYIASFQMAWGAFVYGWIKRDPSGMLVAKRAAQSWWYAAGALPVGLAIAVIVWQQTTVPYSVWQVAPFFLMSISRAATFGISSPMGFGQTLQRNYRAGLKIHAIELGATLALLPAMIYLLGVPWALAAAAIIPWITVFLLRRYSEQIQAHAAQRIPP